MSERNDVDSIAIVGMSGRFPGAPDIDAFWSNLCEGVESVGPFGDDDLRAARSPTHDPAFVNAGAQMDGVEEFDAGFFGMGSREAELTDPQHRIVLEAVWATLEHAGHDPSTTDARIGVFGGVGRNQYFRYNLLTHPELLARSGDYPVMLASEREYAVMRAAFKMGFRGPAVSVNTACSTSGVATHLAVQSLLAGDCDLALAGGARVVVPVRAGYLYQEGNIFSADGHVRAFDANAQGTVIAAGVAFIALRRLEDSIVDGDTIYAVIRGSAINNDGAARIGFTAPGVEGQAAVVEEAMAVAEVDADSIGMLEAHGTGTLLGDPIEVAALTQAYRRHTDRRQYCAIGSLKSNIGHLDTAAGVAGIIKAALSLYHERIPPSINFGAPNPQIDFESSPFFVNTELRAWPRSIQPRRAGVSSFGLGGTNAHIVLEEAPPPEPSRGADPERPRILVLSAKSPEALERRRHLLADHLTRHPDVDLADAAHTLAVGRSRMPHRMAVIADDTVSAVGLLRQPPVGAAISRASGRSEADVVFLFTGTGAQHVGMGAALYRTEPVFREAMDACAEIVGDLDGHDLVELLYGDHEDAVAAENALKQTAIGQPATFALQYALARLWAAWGVEPSAMVGHSVGELAAATVGGTFTLEDGLRLTAARGKLMQDLPVGAMTAILATEAEISPLLADEVSLAAVNASDQCVASGPPSSVESLERRLSAADIPFRRLPIDRAAHSPMMDAMLAPLRDHVAQTPRGHLAVPMVSTMTGTWTCADDIAAPTYWSQHARRTVRFADALGVLLAERPDVILLEVGPGDTLTSLARRHPGLPPDGVAIASLPRRGTATDDRIDAYRALADAWSAGVDIDWASVNGGRRRRIPLPTYPFERKRYWIEEKAVAAEAPEPAPTPMVSAEASGPPRDRSASLAEDGQAPTSGTPEGRTASQLSSIFADLSGLGVAEIDSAAAFTDLGFDSLFLAQFNSQLRRQFGVRVPLERLLTGASTIDSLAAYIERELNQPRSEIGADRPAGGASDAGAGWTPDLTTAGPSGTAAIPLLPNLARYLERDTPHPEHWNVSALLSPSGRLEPDTTGRVVAALLERHDALRLRVGLDGDSDVSWIAPASEPLPFAVSDLSGLAPEEQPIAVERRADELQASLDLAHGPLVRVELFDMGERGQRILVIVHHFVFDQLSWRPFWEDFEALYGSVAAGTTVSPPPPTASFGSWAYALQRRADSDDLREETRIWRDLPWERVRPIPLDHPGGENTNESAEHAEIVFSPEETTALLRATPGVIRKADLLLTALVRTIASWTGSDTALIDLMGHGRDEAVAVDVDPMDSVGFYISYTPLVLRLSENGAQPTGLTNQIEPLLRHGLDFDLLRYMTSDADLRRAFGALPKAEVLFNHHGKLDEQESLPRNSMFRAAPESPGRTHSPQGIRYYPIAVESKFHHGRLHVKFVYSTNLHEPETIRGIAADFRRHLSESISQAMTRV